MSEGRPWPFHRPTYAEIDTRRIQSNFEALRSLFPKGNFICPMVKANAYGHGDVEVVRALRAAGAEFLGVALIEEGISLRAGDDRGAILLFGMFDEQSAEAVIENELTPVISDWGQLRSLEKAMVRVAARSISISISGPVESGTLRIHFKFNTGMNRLGFDVAEAPELRRWLDAHTQFILEGICTHLLRGDDAGAPAGESESQLMAFAEALMPFRDLSFHAHALNSSGTANLWSRVVAKKELGQGGRWPLGSRPGLALYGVRPSSDEIIAKGQIDLKPALSLKSHLVMTRRIRAGERVSYNATWRAKRDSLIGVVPIGYGDGYFRLLSNKGTVLCKGMRAPIAGTICMDYFMADLTDVEAACGEIGIGEEIVLIGEQGAEKILASDLASVIGTIPYEVLTNISERVPRVYLR